MSARKQPTPSPEGIVKPKPPPVPPRPIEEMPDLMTLSEVAQVLRCSAAHVRAKVLSDGLRSVTWGSGSRVRRVYREDLRAYIQAKRGGASA